MGKINMQKVLTGGLIAGVVLNGYEPKTPSWLRRIL